MIPRIAAYGIGLGAGFALLWTAGFVDLWSRSFYTSDFGAIWAGPRILATGGHPYDPVTFRQAVRELGVQEPAAAVYLYPGWVTALLLPLGALDLPTASVIWMLLGVVASTVGLYVLLEAFGARQPLVYATLGFTLLGSEPGITAFYSGQTSLVVTGALALMAAWLVRGHHVAGGIAGAAMLIKPQHFALAMPALALLAVLRGERRFAFSLAAASLALVTLSTLVVPQWWSGWLEHVPAARAADARAANLPTALFDLFGPAGRITGYAALASMLAAAFAFGRSRAALAVWIAASISVSPYLWVYDHILMIVPLAMAAAIVSERSAGRAIAVSLAGMLIMVVAAALLHSGRGGAGLSLSLNGLAQFALTVLIVGSLWPFRREPYVSSADPSSIRSRSGASAK